MSVKNVVLCSLSVVIFVIICVLIYYMAFYDNKDYYYVIDNSKYTLKDNNYRYTLEFYDDNGNLREISFDTVRELKAGAYIKVNYMRLRGVTSWEEVQFQDMPVKTREQFE